MRNSHEENRTRGRAEVRSGVNSPDMRPLRADRGVTGVRVIAIAHALGGRSVGAFKRNSQSWAHLSGLSMSDRRLSALSSVSKEKHAAQPRRYEPRRARKIRA